MVRFDKGIECIFVIHTGKGLNVFWPVKSISKGAVKKLLVHQMKQSKWSYQWKNWYGWHERRGCWQWWSNTWAKVTSKQCLGCSKQCTYIIYLQGTNAFLNSYLIKLFPYIEAKISDSKIFLSFIKFNCQQKCNQRKNSINKAQVINDVNNLG